MKNLTRRLCRAGVIAALYATLTYVFTPFAFGPFQIRPSEALCILPLFFPEAVPALFIGCALSNLLSPYFFYDVVFGSLATLLAAFGSYLVGRFYKKDGWKIGLGGLFPVLLNALILPCIALFLIGDAPASGVAYCAMALSIACTECVWVYGFGAPLYFAVKRLKNQSFLSN